MDAIRVLTLNLWNSNPPVSRFDDLARWLARAGCDLLLLQEVAPSTGRFVTADRTRAHDLADAAGLGHVAYAAAWRSARREEGLAIVSRWPIEDPTVLRLPVDPGRMPRIAIVATTDGLTVATTHLAYRLDDQDLRVRQADALARCLAARPAPTILGGDLNDEPDSAAVGTLRGSHLRDVFADRPDDARDTYALDHPWVERELAGRRIDHLLVDGVTVTAAEVVLDGRHGPAVSDHRGVLATLGLPPPFGPAAPGPVTGPEAQPAP